MGDRTLSQVLTEGWQQRRGSFDLLRCNSYNSRANGVVSMQSGKVFITLFIGFNAAVFLPNLEGLFALEQESDVVLVEPR